MASENKYHLIQTSLQMAEDIGTKILTQLTPPLIEKIVKDSKIVQKGTSTVVAVKKTVDPYINLLDDYSSVVLEWAEDKYRTIFYNNLMKLFSLVKDFYSSENNDYARICLRFLTLAIPDPTYVDTIYPEKFYESFKYDPQFSKDSFQKVLHQFYKHAKEHWLVNKNSKPIEIVRNALFVVANTMEDVLVPHSKRVPFYSQKMADYFVNESPSLALFSRKNFREFYKNLMQEEELDAGQRLLADQFLQIASVLFDLTSMSNKDLIDFTIHTYKFAKGQVIKLKDHCQTTYSFAVKLATQAIPVETLQNAVNTVALQAKTFYKVGKDGVVTIYHQLLDCHPVQYCLDMAHELDKALRNNGKHLIELFRKNEQAFIAFVRLHRAELKEFIKTRARNLEKYSAETIKIIIEFLERQEDVAIEIAEIGKEVVEALYEITTDFALLYREKLSDFIKANYELIKKESRTVSKLVFTHLRLQEIASFVLQTIKSVEEYLCIKESLSKLDLLTNRCVSEVEQRHILSPTQDERPAITN